MDNNYNKNIDYNKNDNYDYIEYLTLKKMNAKIIKSGKSGIELENEIYSKDNITLTEKEKIFFEVSRIYEKIKDEEYFNNLLKLNQNLYSSMSKFIKNLMKINNHDFNNYDDVKKKYPSPSS